MEPHFHLWSESQPTCNHMVMGESMYQCIVNQVTQSHKMIAAQQGFMWTTRSTYLRKQQIVQMIV